MEQAQLTGNKGSSKLVKSLPREPRASLKISTVDNRNPDGCMNLSLAFFGLVRSEGQRGCQAINVNKVSWSFNGQTP